MAAGVHERCRDDGCLGILHSVYASTSKRLAERGTGAPTGVWDRLGYARRVVASLVADGDRSARVARGLAAKPNRTDGVPGRVLASLEATTQDATARRWLAKLFVMMRCFVCRDNRLSAVWPTDVWAAEKTACDGRMRLVGTTSTRQEILDDIRTVLSTAADAVGPEWVEGQILRPFRTVVGPLLDDRDGVVPRHEPDLWEGALVGHFRARYAALRRRGHGPELAFWRASVDVFGREPQGPTSDAIDDLEAWPIGS